MTNQLTSLVRRGAFWVVALKFSRQLFALVKLVFLARTLSPVALGLVAIGNIVATGMDAITVTGLDVALSREDGHRKRLSTAWFIAVTRGVGVGSILAIMAGPIATYFGHPEATSLLYCFAGAFFLRTLANPGLSNLTRSLDFKPLAVLQAIESSVDLVVTVGAVLWLDSALGAGFGVVGGALARTIASYGIEPFRPSLEFDWRVARQLAAFSRWFWLTNTLTLLGNKGDGLVVAKMLGPVGLAAYDAAQRLSLQLTRELSEAVSQISYPTFSLLKDKQDDLRRAYLTAMRVTFVAAWPLSVVLMAQGDGLVRLLLGDGWEAAGRVVGILSLAGLVRGLSATGNWLAYAVNQPSDPTVGVAARTLLLLVLVVPMTAAFGIVGTALTVLVANAGVLFFSIRFASSTLKLSLQSYLDALAAPITISIVAVGPLFLLRASTPWLVAAWSVSALIVYGLILLARGDSAIAILIPQSAGVRFEALMRSRR